MHQPKEYKLCFSKMPDLDVVEQIENLVGEECIMEYIGPLPNLVDLRPIDGYKLWLKYLDGEMRTYDFTRCLEINRDFAPLKDKAEFDKVYISEGAPTWLDGKLDYDPIYIYNFGTPVFEEPNVS